MAKARKKERELRICVEGRKEEKEQAIGAGANAGECHLGSIFNIHIYFVLITYV